MAKLDVTAFVGSKAEIQVINSTMEGMQSTSPFVDTSNKDASPNTTENHKTLASAQDIQNQPDSVSAERTLDIQDASILLDNVLAQQQGFASKRSRSQLKAYIGHAAEEIYVYRSLPLGQDRKHKRYWQFVASASKNDPCSGRIFVELHNGIWRVIDSVEAFDALLSSLDSCGVRESHLRIMLKKIETTFKENVTRNLNSESTGCCSGNEVVETDSTSNHSAGTDSPSSMVCGPSSDTLVSSLLFRIQIGKIEMEKMAALERYQDFRKWIWKECFSSSTLSAMKYGKKRCSQLLVTFGSCIDSCLHEDVHYHSCHHTFSAADERCNFLEHAIQCEERRKSCFWNISASDSLPLGIKLLKALLAFIEVSVPPEAFESFWTENLRKTWGMKLKMSSLVEEVMQLLTMFESAIRRDHLSSNFKMMKELLGAPTLSEWSL